MPTIFDKKVAKAYGSWKSPITSAMIVDAANKLGEIVLDGGDLYWNEGRPSEKGRSVIVKWEQNKPRDISPLPYNVRSRVHEYGGGAFTVYEGTLYFSNFKDQHFYALAPDGILKDLSKAENVRYANPVFDPRRRLIYIVQEHHISKHEVKNSLAAINPEGNRKVKKLHEGHDFYASPALHPEGTHLAFLTWNHPLMPWDGTELWIGQLLPDGALQNVHKVAGGISESIFQPRFSPDGTLYFISDRSGFWNLYRCTERGVEPCCPLDAEFGYPQWIFGLSRYDFLETEEGLRIACIYTVKATDHLALLNPETKELTDLPLPYTYYTNIAVSDETLYFEAGSSQDPLSLLAYHLRTQTTQLIRKSKDLKIDSGYLSIPETIEFPSQEGRTSFGFFYAPKNKDFIGPPDEKPPLIVISHGGPSAHTTALFNLEIQFWTSRGFAVLDVNYGGSTGYGREYRERLKGNWGIVDVDDCIKGALFLAERGVVDSNRLAIRGKSAGGYTTLAALTFRDVFKAGASYYGISDLEALAKDTHKFESHYLEGLIGSYPKEKERYIQASPIHHCEKLSCPVILLQGAEDKVVPPIQAETMYAALKKKGVPVAYILFEGEQHGFRSAENIKKALDAELYFYSKIFHFVPSDSPTSVPIENLHSEA